MHSSFSYFNSENPDILRFSVDSTYFHVIFSILYSTVALPSILSATLIKIAFNSFILLITTKYYCYDQIVIILVVITNAIFLQSVIKINTFAWVDQVVVHFAPSINVSTYLIPIMMDALIVTISIATVPTKAINQVRIKNCEQWQRKLNYQHISIQV